jgi:hypothetical protein
MFNNCYHNTGFLRSAFDIWFQDFDFCEVQFAMFNFDVEKAD